MFQGHEIAWHTRIPIVDLVQVSHSNTCTGSMVMFSSLNNGWQAGLRENTTLSKFKYVHQPKRKTKTIGIRTHCQHHFGYWTTAMSAWVAIRRQRHVSTCAHEHHRIDVHASFTVNNATLYQSNSWHPMVMVGRMPTQAKCMHSYDHATHKNAANCTIQQPTTLIM